jgi:hypothetical protein
MRYRNKEEQIDRVVASEYAALERLLKTGQICIHEYQEEAAKIDSWARKMYEELQFGDC